MNSGSDLALTAILFSLFNGNNTVFVQFRQSTFCRPTISCHVLLVLFAVTSICCTCCLRGQRDICHVSLHFVPQVAFSPLNLLSIFLQWSRGPFLQCDILLLAMIEWIYPQWENGRSQHGDQRWGSTMVIDERRIHNRFYYFCHQIQDKCDKIIFIISMERHLNNINFNFFTFPKSKLQACKSYKLDIHSCHHLPWNSPTVICGDAATQISVVSIITNILT